MSVQELFDLTGKVAVVTGGSRGIGRAIVQAFAEAGADVVIASRKLDACETAAKEVSASSGRDALAVACHVGRWDECDHLIDATLERFGRFDLLVNNAGMSPLYDDLASVTEELYDKTFAVNLKGPFRLGVLAGTYMAGHDGGAIVNVGTIGSLIASPNELPYACAKVRVNAILPGPFRSDITNAWTDEQRAGHYVPLGRLGEPHEAAALALYLACPASSYTTGAIVRVDGGVTRQV